jgi:hypothetical protein
MAMWSLGHGVPGPKPRRVPARGPLPQLFTATVAQIGIKRSGKSRRSVKSGRRQSLGGRERLVIMRVGVGGTAGYP